MGGSYRFLTLSSKMISEFVYHLPVLSEPKIEYWTYLKIEIKYQNRNCKLNSYIVAIGDLCLYFAYGASHTNVPQ
jgi:hypothetical protein